MLTAVVRLLAFTIFLLLTLVACQTAPTPASPPIPSSQVSIQVTATPDIPATVTALADTPTDTPVPTATPIATSTPDIDATVEARLAATIAAMPTAYPIPTDTPFPTASPTPLPTPTPTATPPPTPSPTAVPTATPPPTGTPKPTLTPRPTYTPTSTATPLPSLKFGRDSLVFGPMDGSLVHESKDEFLGVLDGPDTQDEVLIEATFLNPYTTDNLIREHGFLVKDQGRNHLYWVSINSYGEWEYLHRLGDTEALGRHGEESSDIDREPGGRNLLQVVITGDRGWLYINGKLQGGMDLSDHTGGDSTSLFVDDDHPGRLLTRILPFGSGILSWPGLSARLTGMRLLRLLLHPIQMSPSLAL